jgi:hypothetical protein
MCEFGMLCDLCLAFLEMELTWIREEDAKEDEKKRLNEKKWQVELKRMKYWRDKERTSLENISEFTRQRYLENEESQKERAKLWKKQKRRIKNRVFDDS